MTTAQLCLLQPCNSHQSHKNMLSPADNTSKVPSNLSSEAMHLNSVDNDTQVDVLERSTTSDVPTPEQFLSLPEGLTSAPSDLPLTSTPDKEVLGGDDPGTKFLSGKKCRYTESTGTVHSSNSVESFGEAREKRTANSIPDDDDLLSSILVGRRSSVLKLKPTLPIPETMSIKRSRTATRGTASKRKVLMDDTMVVHGEQNLEDEIFSAPIFTGMSVELIFLHTEKFDSSNTKLCKDGKDDASAEVLRVLTCFAKPNVTEETVPSIEPVIGKDDAEAQADLLVETVDQRTEDSNPRSQETDAQVQGITDPVESKHEHLGEMSELEINVNKNEVACSISADVCNMLAEDNIQPSLLDKTNAGDGYLQFMSQDEKLDTEPMEVNALIEDASIQKRVEDLEFSEHNVEIRADVQTEVSESSDRNAILQLYLSILELTTSRVLQMISIWKN